MLEQLFDFCGLYPVARYVRSYTKAFTFAVDSGPRKKFVRDFKYEEHKGVVILQREKRLTDRRQEILAEKKQNDAEIGDSDGEWLEAIAKRLFDIEQKILEMRKLYHAHLIEMRRLLLSTKKDNAFFRGLMMERKCHYSFIPSHNEPYFWLKAKADCARSGGCCGRECRCCDKPLRAYSTGSAIPWKKEGGVYGHCTAECGCCIMHYGGYTPHPLFEDSENRISTP
jgi:hypothetical protein